MVILERLKPHYQRIKELYIQYERLLMPATLVFGFIVDYITFTSIKISTTFSILLVYWCIAGLTILFIHLYDENKISHRFRYLRLFTPLLLQFFFGALLGASFIFYWFSGSFSASWPFILLLIILMISNDIFRHYFQRPVLQIGIYFFVSFSLFSVILPFIFKSISSWLFIAAGIISICIFYGYITLITRISVTVYIKRTSIWIAIGCILALMNLFYFANLIPPIPLSLRDVGVYHDISKFESGYRALEEKENFFEKLVPNQTIHVQPTSRIYVYSAIFAPPQLHTTIYHQWDYFDEEINRWTRKDTLSFPIVGGRKEGYRGYTHKISPEPGKWRISVKTPKGQIVGRVRFTVKQVNYKVELSETWL